MARTAALFILALMGRIGDTSSFAKADQVYFSDGGEHEISQEYPEHNIFVMNGTSVTLIDGINVVAPANSKDGEDAVRVEDAFFHGKSGSISGGLGVGGSGVTITTNRDSEVQSKAIFEAGMEVYGGDAMRETTTRGGDAVTILQEGSEAVFNGGKFVPGTGCTVEVCGQPTSSGNSLQVIFGKAIVKGGTYTGNFFNEKGSIEVHGCIQHTNGRIQGYLLDDSPIDVVYDGNENNLSIVRDESACPTSTTPADGSSGAFPNHSMAGALFWLVGNIYYFFAVF